MKDLKQCREEIDIIDKEILALFEKRMQVCKEVVLYKLENDLPIFQPAREQEVIDKNVNRMQSEILKPYGASLVQDMMNLSKGYQATFLPKTIEFSMHVPKQEGVIVGYQGVQGAFSYQSMKAYFGEVESISYTQFEDVFEALQKDEIDYGIVPLENSSTGAIHDNYDLVRDYQFYIIGEQSISIAQHLLGLSGAKIEALQEVYSHPQGLKQCHKFFQSHPDIKAREYTNTAASAKYIHEMQDITKGAIASLEAAKLYNLEVLQEHLEDESSNHTRFIIVGKRLEKSDKANRVSIVFTLQHQAGTLYQILKVIKEYRINLSRIESRPTKNKTWEYYFYIDFEGNLEEENVQHAILQMKTCCLTLRILGNYEQR